MYKLLLSKHFILIAICFSIFFVSCGTNRVTISPNYKSNLFKAPDSLNLNARVLKVSDKRGESPDYVGIVQTGMFNKKAPYSLNEPVSEFVKKSVTKILSNQNDSLFLPLKIDVNEFKVHEEEGMFSEHGYFDCELAFTYPIGKDSMNTIKTSSHEKSSGMDVTDGLEYLMYEGISACTNEFFNKYKNWQSVYFVDNTDQPVFNTVSDSLLNPVEIDSEKVSKPIRNSDQNLGVTYCSGKNVKYGLQFLYQTHDSLSSKVWAGFGYAFQYYSIENLSRFLEGSFINLNYKYSLRYFLRPSQKGLYFSGGIKLSFGTEKIDYGPKQVNNFFVGPTMDEAVGISINNKVFLEFGAYELKLFGSDLLPDDVGYTAGMYFSI